MNPLFTIFTGTFNRGSFLHRVYQCLLAQTCQDFEWLIIDDGSTDDTRERVEVMIREQRMRIRYQYKNNGGVHTACNLAIRLAAGEFFLRCDSDDEFVPHAIETLLAAWRTIPEKRRAAYTGVSCLCFDERGSVIGDPYPQDGWDSCWRVLSSLKGEKWGFHRTEVLRKHPFPEFPGERFVPESLVWARIAARYRTRCINTPLRFYRSTGGNLATQIPRLRHQCGNAYRLYYREELTRRQAPLRRLKLAANYVRVCLGLQKNWLKIVLDSPRDPEVIAALPLGTVLYLRDRARGLTKARS